MESNRLPVHYIMIRSSLALSLRTRLSLLHSLGAKGEALILADGIVGFAGLEVSSFHDASPFFHSLCEQGEVSPCRFGITPGNIGKGTQVLGALDKSLFKGELSTTSIIQEWALYADIAFDGKIIEKDTLIELDTGTATVIG